MTRDEAEARVNEGLQMLRDFAAERNLGPPIKVMTNADYDIPPWGGVVGVACEWPDEIRNAVHINPAGANHAQLCAIARRMVHRLKEWSAE